MTFEQFLIGIRTRWLVILAMVFLTVGTTVAYSLMQGQIYIARASVLVDLQAVDPYTRRANPLLATEPQQQYFFVNKIFLALSDQVARRMAELDPGVLNPEFVAYWERETEGKGNIQAFYAKILSDSIVVNVQKNSTIIDFDARGRTPEQAAALANAYAKSYIEVNNSIKLRQIQARIDALNAHTEKVKAELEKTWKEFLAARKEAGVTSYSELYSAQNNSLLKLNIKISEKKADEITASNRILEFNKNTDNTPNLTALNFSINALASALSKERAQLQQFKSSLGPQHPSVKEGEARLARLQEMLDTEALRVRQQEQQSLDIYKDSSKQLLTQLGEEKQKAEHEFRERNRLIGLIQKISSLTQNYSDSYLSTQKNITDTTLSFTNLSLISSAMPPTTAGLPDWPIVLLFSGVMGLIIGIGTATALEKMDGRIHSPQLIQKATKIPTLGVLSAYSIN